MKKPTKGRTLNIQRLSNHMGGHEAFRKHIWRNYINQTSALNFIFDASDFSTLEESFVWYWTNLSWIEKKVLHVLFLANKWDLVVDKDETLLEPDMPEITTNLSR